MTGSECQCNARHLDLPRLKFAGDPSLAQTDLAQVVAHAATTVQADSKEVPKGLPQI